MKLLIELHKTNCSECEAAKPVVAELEKEGYKFEKHNIEDEDGRDLWNKYADEIDEYSKLKGWEEGYIYTPTFVNPKSRKVIAFADRTATKQELKELAGLN